MFKFLKKICNSKRKPEIELRDYLNLLTSNSLSIYQKSKIGQLPTALRKDAETVWIHKGVPPFGGGNKNLLIHTGQADLYVHDGILEETLVHEAL